MKLAKSPSAVTSFMRFCQGAQRPHIFALHVRRDHGLFRRHQGDVELLSAHPSRLKVLSSLTPLAIVDGIQVGITLQAGQGAPVPRFALPNVTSRVPHCM